MDVRHLGVENDRLVWELKTARVELENLRDELLEAIISKDGQAKRKADTEGGGIEERRGVQATPTPQLNARLPSDAKTPRSTRVAAHSSPQRSLRRQSSLAGNKASTSF